MVTPLRNPVLSLRRRSKGSKPVVSLLRPAQGLQGLGHNNEAGSYLRLIDSCITQLKAQGPSRTCNESNEKKKKKVTREQEQLSSNDVFQETPARYGAVEPEQWLQRHPEAGSSWPS